MEKFIELEHRESKFLSALINIYLVSAKEICISSFLLITMNSCLRSLLVRTCVTIYYITKICFLQKKEGYIVFNVEKYVASFSFKFQRKCFCKKL